MVQAARIRGLSGFAKPCGHADYVQTTPFSPSGAQARGRSPRSEPRPAPSAWSDGVEWGPAVGMPQEITPPTITGCRPAGQSLATVQAWISGWRLRSAVASLVWASFRAGA